MLWVTIDVIILWNPAHRLAQTPSLVDIHRTVEMGTKYMSKAIAHVVSLYIRYVWTAEMW